MTMSLHLVVRHTPVRHTESNNTTQRHQERTKMILLKNQ